VAAAARYRLPSTSSASSATASRGWKQLPQQNTAVAVPAGSDSGSGVSSFTTS
jgi:hypothetical protein